MSDKGIIILSEAQSRSVDYLHDRIRGETPAGSNVLDLGVGQAKYLPELAQRAGRLTAIEGFEGYLPYVREHAPKADIVHGELPSALSAVRDQGFDVALAIDFIEHLEWSDAFACLSYAKTLANRIVIFTPEGFHPQETAADGFDNALQRHRSEWRPETLISLGFEVERWERFHAWKEGLIDNNALWAVWRKPSGG